MNFEKSLNELESLIQKMETGQLSLEESLAFFEQGIQLANQCQKSLSEAEQKVKVLTENKEKTELKFENFALDES